MAPSTDKDIADQLETIRANITSLSESVSQLVSDTADIHVTLKQRLGNAVSEAEKLGGEAVHAAARGATAAVTGVEAEIARNPLTAVLIALGSGVAIGFLTHQLMRQ